MSRQEDKDYITKRYFEAINLNNLELFRLIKTYQEEMRPVYPLIEFIIDRLTAVTDLTTRNSIWDAEIVHRTALEAFVKFLFITSAEKQEQEVRLNEYWNDLEEINRLKQSEQAKKNLTYFGHIEEMRLSYSPLVCTPGGRSKIKGKVD